MRLDKLITITLSLCFLLAGVLTLPHYGINWDTINHLPRGQAYLHFFLTGKKDFSDLPPWKLYWQKPESLLTDSDIPREEIPRRSYYQNDATTFIWFMEHDGKGHPPLSDIFSSVFNLILFQKLGLINDIDSYRVYGIFLAALLVGLVFWWTSRVYGRFAGLIASLSLALYPLFWSESHFNTEKDIPETVFWAFLLFSIWKGFINSNWRWVLLAGVFFGFALGTKFNVVFSIFVILPWVLFFFLQQKKPLASYLLHNKGVVFTSLLAPLIGVLIFVGSWPYLWADPVARIGDVLRFYREIGLTQNIDGRFSWVLGISTYPAQWILYTTPIAITIFALIGFIRAFFNIPKEKHATSLLLVLWFLLPIVRVTWPGTTAYGGIRQIMEYIPALSILAGIGALTLRDRISSYLPTLRALIRARNTTVSSLLILASFLPLTIRLFQIHPNENVYFNFLISGLKGAKERDFPAWGNSFGAVYRQGVIWINNHAEKNANVVFAYELHPNIPRLFFRTDLNVYNTNRSGYLRNGEYAIALISQGTERRSYYDMYLEEFISPVYQVVVDEVPILKVWKNDESHLKRPWAEELSQEASIKKGEIDGELIFDLGIYQRLSRLEIDYNDKDCAPLKSGWVNISRDGDDWDVLPGRLPQSWRISFLGEQPKDGRFIEPFVGQEARFIRLHLMPTNTCLLRVKDFKIYHFL